MSVAVQESESRAAGETTRPPRLNCAGLCLRCGERDCEASECIEWHEAADWMVCPRCDGEEWSWDYEPCGCIFGVVEAWPPWHPGLSMAV
jgi:hypothetical protein